MSETYFDYCSNPCPYKHSHTYRSNEFNKRKNHWCIKQCGHGTLNGSLELGSLLLAKWNKGYEQGRKDAKYDEERQEFLEDRDYPVQIYPEK